MKGSGLRYVYTFTWLTSQWTTDRTLLHFPEKKKRYIFQTKLLTQQNQKTYSNKVLKCLNIQRVYHIEGRSN